MPTTSHHQLDQRQLRLVAARRKQAAAKGKPIDHMSDAEVWRAIAVWRFLMR